MGGGGTEYLETRHVLNQQPTGKSIGHSQRRENVIDEVEERLCPGVSAVPRDRVEDSIWLTRRRHKPEVGRICFQTLRGDGRYINLRVPQWQVDEH